MASWRTIRGELVTLLGTVAITAPISSTVKRVYATPPAAIQDVPAAVIFPPSVRTVRGQSLRIKTYRVRIRFLVLDSDLDVGADIVDSYREALIDMFDLNLTLNGNVVTIQGPDIDEAKSVNWAGKDYTMFEAWLGLEVKDGISFEA